MQAGMLGRRCFVGRLYMNWKCKWIAAAHVGGYRCRGRHASYNTPQVITTSRKYLQYIPSQIQREIILNFGVRLSDTSAVSTTHVFLCGNHRDQR